MWKSQSLSAARGSNIVRLEFQPYVRWEGRGGVGEKGGGGGVLHSEVWYECYYVGNMNMYVYIYMYMYYKVQQHAAM